MSESSASAAPAPPTEAELQQQLGVQIVDISSGFRAEQVDRADEHINEQTTVSDHAESRLGRIGQAVANMPKKIWYGNVARDFIRQRHIRQGMNDEERQSDYSQSMSTVVERLTDEALDLRKGESNQVLGDVEHGQVLETQISTLISQYAKGDIDADALRECKTRLLSEFGDKVHDDDRKKGIVFADNILEVATNARSAFEHGVGIDEILNATSAKSGEARTGATTEARRDAVDKVLEKVQSTRLGSLVNETTLAIGAGIAMSVTKTVTRSGAMAASRVLGLGVGSGVLGGLRERLRITQDRQLHMRQMGAGGEVNSQIHGKKREQLEATRYETANASDLLLGLDDLQSRLSAGEDIDSATLASAVTDIAHVDTRLKLSDELNADFIAFDGADSIEGQRFGLMKRVAELKTKLQSTVDGLSDDELTQAGLVSRDVNETLDIMSSWTADIMNADVDIKDHVFQKVRRNSTIKMGLISFGSSVVFGTVMQETKAMFSDDLQGVFEHAKPGENHRTMLAGLFKHDTATVSNQVIDGHVGPQDVNEHVSAALPDGYKLSQSPDGFHLIGADGKDVADHLNFDANGHLDANSVYILEGKGVKLHETIQDFQTSRTETTLVDRTPADYQNAHPEQFAHVNRQLWYDNNTAKFDQNELRVDWGSGGTGINENGDYVFNVSRMLPGGSFHGDQVANYQHLIETGQMKFAISTDRGTQDLVQFISIDKDGNAIIDHNSFIGQSTFSNIDGHAHFNGGYVEAVEITGNNPQGDTLIRPLATLVGDNQPKTGSDTITNIIQETQHKVLTEFDVPRIVNTEVPVDTLVEVPPILPIYGREGLEKLKTKESFTSSGDVPAPYTGRSLESMQDWVKETPDRLKTRTLEHNPDGTSQWVEADGSPVLRDVERERQAIGGYVASIEARSPEYFEDVKKIAESMPEMDDDCRVSVNVPAWLEAKQLGTFLDQYVQQVDASGNSIDSSLFEINILINRRTGTASDNSTEVIDNFIAGHTSATGKAPKINYFDIEVDPPHNNVGYIRKLLTDATMVRSVARKDQKEPLYIESEDADILRVDPRTVANLIEKLDANPHLDAVRGRDDRAPEYLKDNDLLFLRRRIWDFSSTLARGKALRDPKNPNWNYMWNRVYLNGWNSGFSAESYALIDGYDEAIAGEDMIIGEKIAMMRGDGKYPNLETIGTVATRSDGSPRRFIIELRSGRDAYGSDFSDEDKNNEMRDSTLEELMQTITKYERITPDNVGAFNGLINGYTKFIRTVTPGQPEANKMMQRVMFWMGFQKDDYQIQDSGEVSISNWDNVKNALESYRQRYDARTA